MTTTFRAGDHWFHPNTTVIGTPPLPQPVVHNHYVNMQGTDEIMARFDRITFLLNQLSARLTVLTEMVEDIGAE